jgi:hypothetical protein
MMRLMIACGVSLLLVTLSVADDSTFNVGFAKLQMGIEDQAAQRTRVVHDECADRWMRTFVHRGPVPEIEAHGGAGDRSLEERSKPSMHASHGRTIAPTRHKAQSSGS